MDLPARSGIIPIMKTSVSRCYSVVTVRFHETFAAR
jgi:hypothetical protein